GDNGKTLLLRIISDVMGSYSVKIDSRVFTNDRSYSDNNRSSDIARTKGARVARCSEPNKKESFAPDFIKQFSQGDDTISAAFKFRDTFEFFVTAKALLECNDMPEIDIIDQALFRRFHFIEHSVQIPAERIDKLLRSKLVEEHDAILGWMIQGA